MPPDTTVTNADLQRQANEMRTDLVEMKNAIKELVSINTDIKLQGQAQAQIQGVIGELVKTQTNLWEAVNANATRHVELRSTIKGGTIVGSVVFTLLQGMVFGGLGWALNTLGTDHTLIAVQESKIQTLGTTVDVIRHLSGN